MPTQRAAPLCKYKRIIAREKTWSRYCLFQGWRWVEFWMHNTAPATATISKRDRLSVKPEAQPLPNPFMPRQSMSNGHTQRSCWSLFIEAFPPPLNVNKKEVTALIGFINTVWNKLCLMTDFKPLYHHWARILRLAVTFASGRIPESPVAVLMNGEWREQSG